MEKNVEGRLSSLSRREAMQFGLMALGSLAFRPRSGEIGESEYWEELSYERDRGRFGAEVDRVLEIEKVFKNFFLTYSFQTSTRPSLTSYIKEWMPKMISHETNDALTFIDNEKNMYRNKLGIPEPVQCFGWAGLVISLLDVPTAKLSGKFGENAIDLIPSDFSKKVAPGTFVDTKKGYGVYRLSSCDPEWKKQIKKGDVFVINQWDYGHVGVILDVLENDKGKRHFLVTDANYKGSIGRPRTVIMSAERFAKEYGPIETIGLLRPYTHEKISIARTFSPAEFDARYPENTKHMYASHVVLPDGTWMMNKPDEWLPLDPKELPVIGLERTPASYMKILELFNIEKSPRFQPKYGTGKNEDELLVTFCNVWARTVSEAMGVPLPPFINGVKMNANLYYRWIETDGAKKLGWEAVDGKSAQESADEGYPTFILAELDDGKTTGHIAPIEPFGDFRDPIVANVGRKNRMHAVWSKIFNNYYRGRKYTFRYVTHRGQGYRLTYFD